MENDLQTQINLIVGLKVNVFTVELFDEDRVSFQEIDHLSENLGIQLLL